MGYGIRNDLRHRFEEAHGKGEFVVPRTEVEAKRLLRAYKRGDILRTARRVYVLKEQWNQLKPIERERRTIRALATLHPTWVFSHVSAAVIHKLEVGYRQLGIIHVACEPRSHARSSASICRHVTTGDQIVRVDGVNVTSLERTAFDCMRSSRFPRALAIADSTLRMSGKSNDEFIKSFRAIHKGHRNGERSIEIMRYADPRAENGGESVARATMIKLGYQIPELQIDIPNSVDPSKPYRVDFYWHLQDGPVAGELDGHDKYIDPAMTNGRNVLEILTAERLRESRISGSHVKVLRFSYNEVCHYQTFSHLLDVFGIPGGREVPPIALM